MKFKVTVLVILVLALGGLGLLVYLQHIEVQNLAQLNQDMEKQRQLEEKQREIERLQNELRQGSGNGIASQTTSAAIPAPPVQTSDRERELEEELAKLRHKVDITSEESRLLIRDQMDRQNQLSEMARQVSDARLVGKVTHYDEESGIIIFQPIGQPSLVGGRQLAIRRNNAIFAYLTVDSLDQETGAYLGNVKMDQFFRSGSQVAPITAGEDVIVPPPMLDDSTDGLGAPETAIPASDAGTANGELAPIPWQ